MSPMTTMTVRDLSRKWGICHGGSIYTKTAFTGFYEGFIRGLESVLSSLCHYPKMVIGDIFTYDRTMTGIASAYEYRTYES